jgi:hypothetical protein
MSETVEVPVQLVRQLEEVVDKLRDYLPRAELRLVEVPGNGMWSEEMIEALYSEVQRYHEAVKLITYLAERGGQEVWLSEATAASGFDGEQASRELGAVTKAGRRLFDGRKMWPMRSFRTAGKQKYFMPAEVAAWWLAAAGRACP